MNQLSPGNKKGQQLIMPMIRAEENPDILNGYSLHAINLRLDWEDILQTIKDNKSIQQTMEKAYQDFQEGYKLKDFVHPNGKKGAWSYKDVNEGIYPYTLTTTNWVIEYEENEWKSQSTADECIAMDAINNAIAKCKSINGTNQILRNLKSARYKLAEKHLPRHNLPESWRPQNASHWSSRWVKVLAEIHYHQLSTDWRMIASNTHSIVAGFTENKIAYLIDIILLTTNTDEIINKLNQEK